MQRPDMSDIYATQQPIEITCKSCGTVNGEISLTHTQGVCRGCDQDMCVVCGCTEDAACIHPDFPEGELNCSWSKVPAVCDHCFQKIAQEEYDEAVIVHERIAREMQYGAFRA